MIKNDWFYILKERLSPEYQAELKKFIDTAYNSSSDIYPKQENIFKALELTSLANTKVIIVGQDPYHTPGVAQGLSFSVPNDSKTPPSLKNIFKELYDDTGIIKLNNDLTNWAKQGVLLLNAVLTVEAHKPNSHANIIWETLTDEIIKITNEDDKPKVFVLWGKFAQTKIALIDNPKHLVITSPHPSPFSARKGFFGSKPFSKINNFLTQNNLSTIEWSDSSY